MMERAAPRRKNGRQQACEPCRRRKVACDHRLPICSRCRRGETPEQCIYLVQSHRVMEAGPADAPTSRHVNLRHKLASPTDTSLPSPTGGNMGYLGATSFSPFYQEAQRNLTLAEKQAMTQENHGPKRSEIARHQLAEIAISTLRHIPDRASSQLLVRLYSSFNDGWCPPAVVKLEESLWEAFGAILEGGRDQAQLEKMAAKLNQNSSIPLKENPANADEWLGSFSGRNLRWESLGHLFAYWSYGATRLPNSVFIAKDCHCLHRNKPTDLEGEYRQGAGRCIELTRETPNANILLAYLVFKYCLMESQVFGDAGLQYWRVHGDLVSLTTFLGLHASPNVDPLDWLISTQMRRRLFAAIFVHDKVTATFTGRPPFLSRRFSSTPLPLDISDEMLLTSSDMPGGFDSLHVDEHGWNTDRKIYSTTSLRARALMAFVRDEILEIALHGGDHSGRAAILKLQKREMEVVAGFPDTLIYQPDDLADLSIQGLTLYTKLLVWLEHLQNLFFIQRLLSKENGEEFNSELVSVSLEIVSLCHIFWTQQKRLGVEDCADWMVVSFSVPAGGVLCMELLKAGGSTTVGAGATVVKKAAIVEHLSMLAGFLEWAGPSAPNREICYSVKRVVRRVIEQALEAPAQPLSMQEAMGQWNVDLTADMNGLFNFDLLDTFDWLRAEGGGEN